VGGVGDVCAALGTNAGCVGAASVLANRFGLLLGRSAGAYPLYGRARPSGRAASVRCLGPVVGCVPADLQLPDGEKEVLPNGAAGRDGEGLRFHRVGPVDGCV
jgi:hypothetical protein